MTRLRLFAVLLVVWLAALVLALQPGHRVPPRITHAPRLEHPVGNLPTLAPFRP